MRRVILLALCGLLFLGCKAEVSDGDFAAKAGQADVLIASGSPKAALRIINGLAKKALGVPQRLGLYRRYQELGESKAAEKWLAAWLKQQPESPELNAVYVRLLIEQKRFAEAEQKAVILEGTAFESLAAELRFRTIVGNDYDNPLAAFSAPGLPELFYGAYAVSGNEFFLEDAAILYAAQGNIEQAAALYPAEVSPALPEESLLFWAAVLLDGGKLSKALTCLSHLPRNGSPDVRLEALLLQADALDSLADGEGAEKIRQEILYGFDPAGIPPVVLRNCARYAELRGDVNARYVLLTSLVRQYPDYAPGLAAYARYAREAVPPLLETETWLEQDVRAAGMQTRRMEARDSVPPVPLESARGILKDAAERGRTLDGAIAYLQFLLLLNPRDDKFAVLWDYLEKNLGPDNSYPPELAHLAVSFLLTSGQEQMGEEFFNRYIRFRYNEPEPGHTGFSRELLERLASWEIEALGRFAGQKGDALRSRRLYAYLTDEIVEFNLRASSERTYRPPPHIFVNLAELAQGTGRLAEAIDYYQKALEAAAGTSLGAALSVPEILYRLGKIQYDSRDIRLAASTLKDCLALDPNHQKARFLLRQIDPAH